MTINEWVVLYIFGSFVSLFLKIYINDGLTIKDRPILSYLITTFAWPIFIPFQLLAFTIQISYLVLITSLYISKFIPGLYTITPYRGLGDLIDVHNINRATFGDKGGI